MLKQFSNGLSNQPEQSCLALIPVRYADMPIQMNSIQRQIVSELKNLRNKEKNTKQCRICLESGQQKSKLIKPCKCTGSIQYTHEHCLTQWITRKIQKKSDNKVKCEVCQIEFNYKLSIEKIFDCNQLKRHYQKQKKGLVCFTIIYCLLFLFFIAMLVLSIVGIRSTGVFLHQALKSSSGVTVMITCMIIYFLGLVVVAVLFVSEYLVKQKIVIGDVLRYRQLKKVVKNYRIHFKP